MAVPSSRLNQKKMWMYNGIKPIPKTLPVLKLRFCDMGRYGKVISITCERIIAHYLLIQSRHNSLHPK